MKVYGLIGKKLTHSFSSEYFSKKFLEASILDAEYRNFPLNNIIEFPEILNQFSNIQGLNVTIPYKQAIVPFLDSLDETASELGAVNCIQFCRKHQKIKLKGYNTDVLGFEQSLLHFCSLNNRKALVLGRGGAAKAVAHILKKHKVPLQIVSRKKSFDTITYNDLNANLLKDYTLIINTTPLGMFPDVDTCPDIPWDFIGHKHVFYDLVYNPAESLFLKYAKARGAMIKNGMEMLRIQAEESWRIWNNPSD